MKLTNKKIYIITPQAWQSNFVSKHHYARELARRGNTVYFINPPKRELGKKSIDIQEVERNLHVVSPCIPIPNWMRFKLPSLYNKLVTSMFRDIIEITDKPDILWNFDNETYFEQEYLFEDSTRIFHPVDHFEVSEKKEYQALYDFAFSVSPELLKLIPVEKKWFINHGLNPEFVSLAETNLGQVLSPSSEKDGIIKAGYVGNLSIRFLNKQLVLDAVHVNPEIEFHFIGNHEKNDDFIDSLKSMNNTVFPGVIRGDDLYQYLRDMDMLFVCYKKQQGYLGDNSHKVLEYLSTGVPVISSPLTVYDDFDLIDFEDDISFPKRFSSLINEANTHRGDSKSDKRMAYAINNSYRHQVDLIETHLKQAVGSVAVNES